MQTYLSCLADLGAFADDRFLVECEAGINGRPDQATRVVTVLLVFQPACCDVPVSLTIHQTASGCRVVSTAFAPPLT